MRAIAAGCAARVNRVIYQTRTARADVGKVGDERFQINAAVIPRKYGSDLGGRLRDGRQDG
ncbi:MAG: hypothetical protein SGI88_15060, partial [Candidatus Hydrogenedentes bacterium]|nr:hypothetical protein [Candidatus Hydrogenedentota bacterium]